jgi:pimeloyl-ACP methyl ester carboxylesterase
MADLPVHHFRGPAGVDLAWREAGDGGRPVVLLHGLFGNGASLAGPPLAQALVTGGHRVILPDLRGHGDSGRPHDLARYPPDVAADDLLAAAASGDAPVPGSPEEAAAGWLAQSGVDPLAVSHLLGSLAATPPDTLSRVPVPVRVIVGDDDPRGASAGELARLFADGQVVRVPGDHTAALAASGFGAAVLEFLGS